MIKHVQFQDKLSDMVYNSANFSLADLGGMDGSNC